jgi:hypothetical protein
VDHRPVFFEIISTEGKRKNSKKEKSYRANYPTTLPHSYPFKLFQFPSVGFPRSYISNEDWTREKYFLTRFKKRQEARNPTVGKRP